MEVIDAPLHKLSMKDKLNFYREQKNSKKEQVKSNKLLVPAAIKPTTTTSASTSTAVINKSGKQKRRPPTEVEIQAKLEEAVMFAHAAGIEVVYQLHPHHNTNKEIENEGRQMNKGLHPRPVMKVSSQDVCVSPSSHVVLGFHSPRRVYYNERNDEDLFSPLSQQTTTDRYDDDDDDNIINTSSSSSSCSVTTRRLWNNEETTQAAAEEEEDYFQKIGLDQCQDLLVDDDPVVIPTPTPAHQTSCTKETNLRLRNDLIRCEQRLCQAAQRTVQLIDLLDVSAHQPRQLAVEKRRNNSVLIDILYGHFYS